MQGKCSACCTSDTFKVEIAKMELLLEVERSFEQRNDLGSLLEVLCGDRGESGISFW